MDVFVDNVTGAHGAPLSEDTDGPAVRDHGQVALMRPPTLWPWGLQPPWPHIELNANMKGGVVEYKPLCTLRGLR